MARGLPSMTALLGLLAVAGFQNKDKLGEMFGQVAGGRNGSNALGGGTDSSGGGLGGLLKGIGGAAGLGGLFGGSSAGGSSGGNSITDGLGGLMDRFKQNGHGDAAESWIKDGPNSAIDDRQLAQAIGPDVLDDLKARTGLSQEELLSRLSRELPNAVDQLTPHGRLPNSDEFPRY